MIKRLSKEKNSFSKMLTRKFEFEKNIQKIYLKKNDKKTAEKQ